MMARSKGAWDYKVRVPALVDVGEDGRVVVVVVRETGEEEEEGKKGRGESGRMGWILIGGKGGGGRIGRGVMGVERLIGVREPVWDVEVRPLEGGEGGMWRVGVEWDVIGEG